MQQLSAGHDQDQQPGRASIRLARPNNTNPSSGSNGENNMTSSSQVEKTRNRKPCVPSGASTRSRTQGAARMQPRLMFFPAGKNATHLTCARAISNQYAHRVVMVGWSRAPSAGISTTAVMQANESFAKNARLNFVGNGAFEQQRKAAAAVCVKPNHGIGPYQHASLHHKFTTEKTGKSCTNTFKN